MDKLKKFIAPIVISLYLLYILLTTEYEMASTPLSYLLRSIGKMPESMIKGLVVLGVLIVISVAIYIYFMKAGESDE